MGARDNTVELCRTGNLRAPALLLRTAVGAYFVTLVLVILAAIYAQNFIPEPVFHFGPHHRGSVVKCMAAWDGQWYARIATTGYTYSRTEMSAIVFFPAYPLLAKILVRLSHLSPDASLLIVSNACLLAALISFAFYVRDKDARTGTLALLSLALFPTTFFFRMAYTESTFLFLVILALLGMKRQWPPIVIALIIGSATATRSTGVALLAPFALHLWAQRVANGSKIGVLPIVRGASLLVLASWGLIAFAIYQYFVFHDPLAFAKAQMVWHEREVPSLLQRVRDLVTLEPVRSVYVVGSPCYWAKRPPLTSALLSLQFANPIYFLGTAIVIIIGGFRRWLTRGEWVLAALLLLIPYVMQSPRMCMISQARFASVVFPAYVVMGHLLARLPDLVVAFIFAFSVALMGAYAALFTSWYPFF